MTDTSISREAHNIIKEYAQEIRQREQVESQQQ